MRLLKVWMLLLCCSLPTARVFGQPDSCPKIPRYKLGKVIASDEAELLQYVSIAPDRFNRSDLLCLARGLRLRFVVGQHHMKVGIYIYDDADAASQLNPRVFT